MKYSLRLNVEKPNRHDRHNGDLISIIKTPFNPRDVVATGRPLSTMPERRAPRLFFSRWWTSILRFLPCSPFVRASWRDLFFPRRAALSDKNTVYRCYPRSRQSFASSVCLPVRLLGRASNALIDQSMIDPSLPPLPSSSSSSPVPSPRKQEYFNRHVRCSYYSRLFVFRVFFTTIARFFAGAISHASRISRRVNYV